VSANNGLGKPKVLKELTIQHSLLEAKGAEPAGRAPRSFAAEGNAKKSAVKLKSESKMPAVSVNDNKRIPRRLFRRVGSQGTGGEGMLRERFGAADYPGTPRWLKKTRQKGLVGKS